MKKMKKFELSKSIIKSNEDMREKLNEKKETIDYCPGCNVAYCQGRYTTGQCE